MTSQTLEALKKILEQIKVEAEWNQNGLFSPDGKRLCLVGRIYSLGSDKAIVDLVLNRCCEALKQLKQSPNVGQYNDTHSHAEVVALVEKALAIEVRSVSVTAKLLANKE